ncbi:hypothetical protein AVEN_90720-1, partial [Araneus ventricosus]
RIDKVNSFTLCQYTSKNDAFEKHTRTKEIRSTGSLFKDCNKFWAIKKAKVNSCDQIWLPKDQVQLLSLPQNKWQGRRWLFHVVDTVHSKWPGNRHHTPMCCFGNGKYEETTREKADKKENPKKTGRSKKEKEDTCLGLWSEVRNGVCPLFTTRDQRLGSCFLILFFFTSVGLYSGVFLGIVLELPVFTSSRKESFTLLVLFFPLESPLLQPFVPPPPESV